MALSGSMSSTDQQGSSLGSFPTFPSPKPTFGSLTLCQVLSSGRQQHHLLRKSLKTLLRNAVSLSTNISAGAPRSQNRLSKWLITLAASCHLRWRQIENCVGPQSMSDRVSALVVGYIHSHCGFCLSISQQETR